MAARKGRSYEMGNEHRDKIKNSNILNALLEHAMGTREMTQSQCTVGLGLLKKVMPDLASIELGSDPDRPLALGIAWLNSPQTTSSESLITPESSSSPSTTAPNDLPASSAIAEPEKL